MYINIGEGGIKRGKLSHGVAGAFRIVKVKKSTNTVPIHRGDVVERVAMNRFVRAPSTAPIEDSEDELKATSKDFEEKVTEEKNWVMMRILNHHESDDGTLEFCIELAGKCKPIWKPRTHIPEESISRYMARRKNRERESAQADKLSGN